MNGPLNIHMHRDTAKRFKTLQFHGGVSGITGKILPDYWVTIDSFQVWRDGVRTINQTVGAQHATRRQQRNQTAEYNASNRLTADRVVYFVSFATEQCQADVIAVFPDITANPGRVMIYAHIGQHCEASCDYVRECLPATSRQYRELHREVRDLTIRYDNRDLRIIDPIECQDSLGTVRADTSERHSD